MTEQNRPDINPDEYDKKVGSDMPEREPLELLPEREWLNAHIQSVVYQVAMFNNQVQYMTYKDENEQDVEVLDDNGQKIMRKEFEFVFIFDDYDMPKGTGKRKAWLRLGASFGEKAHLPQFLAKVLSTSVNPNTPQSIIDALRGQAVQLQLKNKLSKDETKTYQNVVWDAVRLPPISAVHTDEPSEVQPEPEDPPPAKPVDDQYCQCGKEVSKPVRVEKNGMIIEECSVCTKVVQAWDDD